MDNRFTQKAQNALNLSLTSASELGHTYIGSEHLLMGLSREGSGIAAQCLSNKGITRDMIRESVVRITGTGEPSAVSAAEGFSFKKMRALR